MLLFLPSPLLKRSPNATSLLRLPKYMTSWDFPAIIPSRLILQEIWGLQLDWDSPVPKSISQKWSAWTSQLNNIANHPSRRLATNSSPAIFKSLHGFADALELAYGAVIYLRTLHEDNSISISLIFSKARVAPLSKTTIPRLELVTAHLLSKLLQRIAKLLDI